MPHLGKQAVQSSSVRANAHLKPTARIKTEDRGPITTGQPTEHYNAKNYNPRREGSVAWGTQAGKLAEKPNRLLLSSYKGATGRARLPAPYMLQSLHSVKVTTIRKQGL